MGKNQLSAILEAYLLFCMGSGTIVKAAPTFQPQIINSRQRLLSMLETGASGGGRPKPSAASPRSCSTAPTGP